MTDDRTNGVEPEPVELSPSEREALAALPRDREPGRLMEERTVRALREQGLLATLSGSRRQSGSRPERAEGRLWWRSTAVAAAVALFAGGVSVGQMLGARQTAGAFKSVFEDGDTMLAAEVQRAGSDYVAALAALSEPDGGAAADTSQALEVALTALWAAANEIVRLAPDDVLTARILQGFEAKAQESDDYGADSQLLVEF
jgi:hypothetical protein